MPDKPKRYERNDPILIATLFLLKI